MSEKYATCNRCKAEKLFYNHEEGSYECEGCGFVISREDIKNSLDQAYHDHLKKEMGDVTFDISKIKIFSIDGVEWITGLDIDGAKKWYAESIGMDIEDICEIQEESLDGGFWMLDMELNEVLAEIEHAAPKEPVKAMKISDNFYGVWVTFKKYIIDRYQNAERFEPEFVCSAEY